MSIVYLWSADKLVLQFLLNKSLQICQNLEIQNPVLYIEIWYHHNIFSDTTVVYSGELGLNLVPTLVQG